MVNESWQKFVSQTETVNGFFVNLHVQSRRPAAPQP